MVKTLMMATAFLATACTGAADNRGSADGDDPLIALYLATEEERSGAEVVEFDGRQLFVDHQALITDADISDVAAERGEDEVVLDVRLHAEGAERLRAATTEHVGRTMVVMFGSRVVNAPTIRSQIGPRGQLVIPASPEQAEEIVAQVRARWPVE